MKLTFEKENKINYHNDEFGSFKSCNLFQLFNNDVLIGEFIVSEQVAFISTNYSRLRIDIFKHFFKSTRYEIVDIKTEKTIGKYVFPNWILFDSKEIGTLYFNNETFTCRRQRPAIRSNIFKKATWGHNKLILTNSTKEIDYEFKVETRWIEPANSEFRKATGIINSKNAETELIFVGLFFIERKLNIDDSISD